MILVQITDMHVKASGVLYKEKVDTHAHMARAIDHILAFDPLPDAVVATGDLVDAGSAEEYAALETLTARLSMPVYRIPGNHDDRAAMCAAFPGHDYLPAAAETLDYVIDAHPIRIIGLDSLIPGEVGGIIRDTQCDWLDETLAAAPETPTILMLHHPPAGSGVPWLDVIGLDNADRLGEVVARHGQIQRVLCGHDHRPIQTLWAGALTITGPSTAHQFVLTFDEDSSGRWITEPPACLIHRWLGPERGLVTHTSYIGDYGPPQPFN